MRLRATSRSIKGNTSKDEEIPQFLRSQKKSASEKMSLSDILARWCKFSKRTVRVRVGEKVVGRAMLVLRIIDISGKPQNAIGASTKSFSPPIDY